MADTNRKNLDAARAWLDDWKHVVLVVAGAIIFGLAGYFIPLERWEKLGHFLTDPATAIALGGLGTVGVGLYRRARGLPPSLLPLVLALGLASSGCGASALDLHARGVTVALRAIAVAEDLYLSDEGARMDACAPNPAELHDACVHAERERGRPAEAAIDGALVVVRAWGASVATAAALPGEEPMAAVLEALGRLAALWPGVVQVLGELGIAVPALPPGLVALLGGA